MAREIGESKEGDLAEEMMIGSKADGGQCHRQIVKGTGPSTNREKNGWKVNKEFHCVCRRDVHQETAYIY